MITSGCSCENDINFLNGDDVFMPMATDPCTKGTYYTSIQSGAGQAWLVSGSCSLPCDYFPPDPGFTATSANSGLMVFVPCGDSSAPPIYTECVNQYVGTSGGVNAFQFCGGVNTQVNSSTCSWTNDTYDGTSPTYPALANTYVMCCSGTLDVNVYNNDVSNSPLTVTVIVGGTGTTNTVSASAVWSGQFAVSSGDLVYINGPLGGTYTANTISGTVAFAGGVSPNDQNIILSWGENGYGQLGQDSITPVSSPTQAGSDFWSYLGAGINARTISARRLDQSLWLCGRNAYSDLGDGTVENRSSFVQIYGGGSWLYSAEGIVGGGGIKDDGSLWVWGTNNYGVLGQDLNVTELPSVSSPIQTVAGGTDWEMLAAGNSFFVALKNDNSLWGWGTNFGGQLGVDDTVDYSSPVQIGTDYVYVACGPSSTFAIKKDGSLWSWGSGNNGNTGTGSSPTQIGTDTDWDKVSASYSFAGALKTNKKLYLWSNGFPVNSVFQSSPVQQIGTWSDFSFSNNSILAISAVDETLWTWGTNYKGLLGVDSGDDTLFYSNPVQIMGGAGGFKKVTAGENDVYVLQNINATPVASPSPTIQITPAPTPTPMATDTSLWMWGYNYDGVFYPYTDIASSPVQVGGVDDWAKVYDSLSNTAFVKNDGTLWISGNNSFGQCANDTAGMGNNASSPVQEILNKNWVSVSVGNSYFLAIDVDGHLWGWGYNGGTLGISTTVDVSTPVQIGTAEWKYVNASNCDSVSNGANFGIQYDGSLWAWGRNFNGLFGDDKIHITEDYGSGPAYVNYSSPVQVGLSTDFASVVTGGKYPYYSSFAIKTDGTLWVAGSNYYNLLTDQYLQSDQYSSFVQVGTDTNWKSIKCGYAWVAAQKTDNTIWAWGLNGSGQLSTDNIDSYSSPVQVGLSAYLDYTVNESSIYLLDSNSYLWACGRNDWGQLAQDDILYRSSLVQIGSGLGFAWHSLQNQNSSNAINIGAFKIGALTPTPTESPTPTILITPMPTPTPMATNSGLFMWGRNYKGILGNDSDINASSPVQIGNIDEWAQVSTSNELSAFIKQDGTLWLAGSNYFGQLGIDDTSVASYSSPVQEVTYKTWVSVAIGNGRSAFAIDTDGYLYSWGENSTGQLALGNTFNQSKPVQINTEKWKSVCSSGVNSFGIHYDGSLWAWGYNSYGSFGDDSKLINVDYITPVQIGSSNDFVVAIPAQPWNASFTIKTDGTLWAAGRNGYYFFTDQYPLNVGYSSFVQIGSDTNWKSIKTTSYSVLAQKTDNTIWGWGLNNSGLLSQDNTVDYSSPVQIGSAAYLDFSIGNGATYLLDYSQNLWACGVNYYGQLGADNVLDFSSLIQVASGAASIWNSLQSQLEGYQNNFGAFKIVGPTPTPSGTEPSPTPTETPTDTPSPTPSESPTPTETETPTPTPSESATPTPTFTQPPTATPLPTSLFLYTWGENNFGQLGLNISEIAVSSPTVVGSVDEWIGYYSANSHNVFLKNDNTIWSAGSNSYGELGIDDTANNYSSPIQEQTNSLWRSVAIGYRATMGIKFDGTLWGWGSNYTGNLGTGGIGPTPYNTKISSPTQEETYSNQWFKIATNGYTTAATKLDGSLWAWGYNYQGCFGDDNYPINTFHLTPVQIGTDVGWQNIGFSYYTSYKTAFYAIKGGSLFTAGYNYLGQLGLDSDKMVNVSSLTQVGTDTNWDNIIGAGDATVVASKNDNTLWGWGRNYYGQLGQDNTEIYSSPVQILGSFVNFTTNDRATYFVDSSGANFGIGNLNYYANIHSPLWDGFTAQSHEPVITSSVVQIAAGITTYLLGNDQQNAGYNDGNSVALFGLEAGATPTETPTPTPSDTPSPTPSESPSPTPSPSPSSNPTPTPSPSPSESPSPTPSDSPSPTPSESPTPTPTGMATATETPSPTVSSNPTPTPSPSNSPNPTNSPTPSPSGTPAPTPSESPTPTNMPSQSPTATAGPTPTATPAPTASNTPSPTASPSPSLSASPTPSPSPSGSPTPTPSESPSPTPSESPTPTPSESPTPTPSESPSPTPSPSPSESPTPTPSESPSPTPSPTPSDSPSPTPSPSPSESPSPTPSPSPSPGILPISPPTLGNSTINIPFSQLLTTSGGVAPYTYSINSGSLPAGVTLDSSGLLSGTPTVDGTFSFNVHVVDSGAPTATGDQPYTWTINPPVSVEPPTLNAMVQGITFMGGCYSVGGTPAYTYSVVGGALPAGLTLDVGGTINGAPTVVGPYSVTIQSTDSVGATGTRTYTGEVVPQDIEVQASTDFAVAAIAMPYQGWAFGNMGTGMGSPSIRFVQISGSTQSVRITLRNNSAQTFLVNVNSINYAVYASENFDKTFAVPQNGIMTVAALTGGFFPASSVTGAVYVNAPADCAYRLKLTPTVRAVEGDEGSLDTSVINGRSMQRTGYLTITENVTQVKVMELPDGSCINTQIQQLPDVIPLITDGYPQG